METTANRSLTDKIVEGLKYHLVDTTAILSSTNPVFSAMEIGVSRMPDQVSIDSRLVVAGLSYAGLGFAYSRGRDLSRKFFHINNQTNEKVQTFHDSAYTFTFNLTMIPIYLSQGADLKQAIIGGVSGAILGIGLGPVMGYSIDTARDLTGLQNCERVTYPDSIRRQRPVLKKSLATLLAAGSIAAMVGIYTLTSNS